MAHCASPLLRAGLGFFAALCCLCLAHRADAMRLSMEKDVMNKVEEQQLKEGDSVLAKYTAKTPRTTATKDTVDDRRPDIKAMFENRFKQNAKSEKQKQAVPSNVKNSKIISSAKSVSTKLMGGSGGGSARISSQTSDANTKAAASRNLDPPTARKHQVIFDAFAFSGGGHVAFLYEAMGFWATYQHSFHGGTVKHNLQRLIKDKVMGSNSGGSWFSTAILHDESLQAVMTLDHPAFVKELDSYFRGVAERKTAAMSSCSGSFTGQALVVLSMIPQVKELSAIKEFNCVDDRQGQGQSKNFFWENCMKAFFKNSRAKPTFDVGSLIWTLQAAMYKNGAFGKAGIDHGLTQLGIDNGLTQLGNRLAPLGRAARFDFPDIHGNIVVPIFFKVSFAEQSTNPKPVSVWIPLLDGKKTTRLSNMACTGLLGACTAPFHGNGPLDVEVNVDDMKQVILDRYTADFPKMLSFASSNFWGAMSNHFMLGLKGLKAQAKDIETMLVTNYWLQDRLTVQPAEKTAGEEGYNFAITDGGISDDTGIVGAVRGLQEKFPTDKKTTRRILAYHVNGWTIDPLYGLARPIDMQVGGTDSDAMPHIFDNATQSEKTFRAGHATLRVISALTVDHRNRGIKGGYRYEVWAFNPNCEKGAGWTSGLVASMSCLVADPACLEYYHACAMSAADMIKVLEEASGA